MTKSSPEEKTWSMSDVFDSKDDTGIHRNWKRYLVLLASNMLYFQRVNNSLRRLNFSICQFHPSILAAVRIAMGIDRLWRRTTLFPAICAHWSLVVPWVLRCSQFLFLAHPAEVHCVPEIVDQVTPTDELLKSLDALQRLSGALWVPWMSTSGVSKPLQGTRRLVGNAIFEYSWWHKRRSWYHPKDFT